MLTFKQYCVNKRKITQAQRASIPSRHTASEIVEHMIRDALAVSHKKYRDGNGGLVEEDINKIFNHQPVHFGEYGFAAKWFYKWEIEEWGMYMFARYPRPQREEETGAGLP